MAPIYGSGGAAESAVGKWLDTKLAEATQHREDATFVASNCRHEKHHHDHNHGTDFSGGGTGGSSSGDGDKGTSSSSSSSAQQDNDPYFRRQDVYLVGKACHPARDQRPRLNASALAEDLAGSLRRLKGATYLDLLLLHRDDPSVPVEEVYIHIFTVCHVGKNQRGTCFEVCARAPHASSFLLLFFNCCSCCFIALKRSPPWCTNKHCSPVSR